MPITVTLPGASLGTAARDLSSRKLLDIAVRKTRTRDSDVQSAIVELKQRRHYLQELEAKGL